MTSNNTGAVAVEFVLVAPVLLLLVFGAIDWGNYFVAREVVVAAAREGARAGTLGAIGVSPQQVAHDFLVAGNLDPAGIVAVDWTDEESEDCPTGTSCMTIRYRVQPLTGFLQPPLIPQFAVAEAQMRL